MHFAQYHLNIVALLASDETKYHVLIYRFSLLFDLQAFM